MRACGETRRRASLRSSWRNPWRCKFSHAHQFSRPGGVASQHACLSSRRSWGRSPSGSPSSTGRSLEARRMLRAHDQAGASPAAPTIYGRRPDRRGQRLEPAWAPCGPLGCESLAFRQLFAGQRSCAADRDDALRITQRACKISWRGTGIDEDPGWKLGAASKPSWARFPSPPPICIPEWCQSSPLAC